MPLGKAKDIRSGLRLDTEMLAPVYSYFIKRSDCKEKTLGQSDSFQINLVSAGSEARMLEPELKAYTSGKSEGRHPETLS